MYRVSQRQIYFVSMMRVSIQVLQVFATTFQGAVIHLFCRLNSGSNYWAVSTRARFVIKSVTTHTWRMRNSRNILIYLSLIPIKKV